jgi:hypothetical protein
MLGKHGFQEPNFDMALAQWAGTTGWEAIMAGKISAKMRAKRKIFDRIDQQASELLAFLQQYVAHKSVNQDAGHQTIRERKRAANAGCRVNSNG